MVWDCINKSTATNLRKNGNEDEIMGSTKMQLITVVVIQNPFQMSKGWDGCESNMISTIVVLG